MTDRLTRHCPCLVLTAGLLLAGRADSAEDHAADPAFMVIDTEGTALLGPDGDEIERLDPIAHAAGAISPDGHWIAFAEAREIEAGGGGEHNMIVESRAEPRDRRKIPQVWGTSGSSFLPLWSSDSKRILICEQGWKDNKTRESAYRIYDLTTEDVTDVELPKEWWPSDWSADGKRLLVTLEGRVAWVNIDGTGEPELITPRLEVAYGARLSPDGTRILCLSRLKGSSDGQRRSLRLSVVDLKTAKRTIVDDSGETYGYCWSRDGSRIAYTWQRSRERPARGDVLETFLITCDPDGGGKKTVTSRTYKVPENSSSTGAIFFQVLSWR